MNKPLQIEVVQAIEEMTIKGMRLNECIGQAKEIYDREIKENELRSYKKMKRNAYEKMRRDKRK